jgi:shikimate dehydrogenase
MTGESILPRSAGVIGWPVAHSKSPVIHRYWLDQLGLDGDYGRFPVHPDRLEAAIRALPALGLAGVNVTVPHKQAVMPFLDAIADAARAVGAVNTIVVRPDGTLEGRNTDWLGVIHAIPINEEGRHVAIIGAGGAARAAVHAARHMRAGRITLLNRSADKARALLENLGMAGDVMPLGAAPACDLLINASPLGMTGQPPLAMTLDALPDTAAVFDMVYAPLETPLLAAARARGLRAIDGIEMLIGQAAEAFRLFYGERPHDADLKTVRNLLIP